MKFINQNARDIIILESKILVQLCNKRDNGLINKHLINIICLTCFNRTMIIALIEFGV